MSVTIALAGNPNCGKTTMFNALTGANQYVGNWPGVTVEKKEGKLKNQKDVTVTFVCFFRSRTSSLRAGVCKKTRKCQKTCDPGFSYSLRDHFWNAAPSSGSFWRCTP